MNDTGRAMDRWLKWTAIMGPFFGFILGVGSGTMIAYQAYKSDSARIVLLEGWKEKQEDFNVRTVAALSRLKALIKDTQP